MFHSLAINSVVLGQKQISRSWTSNYIPQIPQDIITFPYTWYLLLEVLSVYHDDLFNSYHIRFAAKIILKATQINWAKHIEYFYGTIAFFVNQFQKKPNLHPDKNAKLS